MTEEKEPVDAFALIALLEPTEEELQKLASQLTLHNKFYDENYEKIGIVIRNIDIHKICLRVWNCRYYDWSNVFDNDGSFALDYYPRVYKMFLITEYGHKMARASHASRRPRIFAFNHCSLERMLWLIKYPGKCKPLLNEELEIIERVDKMNTTKAYQDGLRELLVLAITDSRFHDARLILGEYEDSLLCFWKDRYGPCENYFELIFATQKLSFIKQMIAFVGFDCKGRSTKRFMIKWTRENMKEDSIVTVFYTLKDFIKTCTTLTPEIRSHFNLI